jgi:PASTA domain-containing protein/List-Bact-rpt repeat protein
VHGARIRPVALAALAGALVLGGLAAAPTAHAAITGSQITTPADPSFLVADETTAGPTFAVAGTATGGNPSTDEVDIRCYYGATSALVAKNVALKGDRSFSVPAADLNKVLDLTCRLRAVPAGTNPSDVTAYSGPLIGVGERDSTAVGGGPNNGHLYDYYLYAPQQTAGFDYESLGSCGLNNGYLFDQTYALATTTFYCNAGLLAGDSPAPKRSELQIDGANAYTPDQAASIAPNATGLPTLTYSYTADAHTGDLVVHETDPLVTCSTATYPPTTASCGTFVTAGVTDNRTITQDHDGHVSWITDTFAGTDGKAHSLDLLWDNSQHFWGPSGNSAQVEYEFPGQTGFSTHAVGDSVSLPPSPGTILVRMHGAADGNTSTGQGAIVYDRPATAATFTNVVSFVSQLTLHQTGKIPAKGSTRFRFAYVQDFQAANVASLAQAAGASFLETIAVKKSGKGTVKSSPGGIACGKACSHGYAYGTPVTLGAVPAKGSRFVGWSGPCKGSGLCTVAANDDVTVRATFAVRRCVVPDVVGKTLKAAKRALTRADCAVGKVTAVPSSRAKKGHVVSQKPKRGKRLRARTKVRLVVSAG